MCLYLRAKYEVSSIILTGFRQSNFNPSPTSKQAPKETFQIRVKMTKIELELIRDPDMYISFEKGTRAKISYISNRYSKANNKYLKSYDPKEELEHLT